MNFTNLRQRINESCWGIRINDSNIGLRFEGAHRAATLDEFLGMAGGQKVTAHIRIRESRAVDTHYARFTSETPKGRKMIYDQELGGYRHHLVAGANRRRALNRTKNKVETELEGMRSRIPYIETELRDGKVQLQGLSVDNKLTLTSYAAGLVFERIGVKMMAAATKDDPSYWAGPFIVAAAGCFVIGTMPYFNRALVWHDKRSEHLPFKDIGNLKMMRPENLAKRVIDAQCVEMGFDPGKVYESIYALSRFEDFADVRLSFYRVQGTFLLLCAEANYIGERKLDENDSKQDIVEFFKQVTEETGVRFGYCGSSHVPHPSHNISKYEPGIYKAEIEDILRPKRHIPFELFVSQRANEALP